jgi:DICT domain-containing protein
MVLTFEVGATAGSFRPLTPSAQLLRLACIVTKRYSSVQTARLDAALRPVHDGRHIVLGSWAVDLETVAAAVSVSDKIRLVQSSTVGRKGTLRDRL